LNIFQGPTGVLIQQHHYQAVPTNNSTPHSPENNSNSNSSSNYNLNNTEDYAHTSACQFNKNRSDDKIDDNRSYSNKISVCGSTTSDQHGFIAMDNSS
jgi:hypothetical protein